jgi:hypothetical protein
MLNNCPVDVVPYDKSGLTKNPSFVNLNYTNQDFWSLKDRLIKYIQERFGPNGSVLPNTFNDFVESDLGIVLIENQAFIGDTLSFKIDQIANEIYTDTVTEVENMFRIAKAEGFEPQPPIAATSFWTGSIISPLTTELRIPSPISVQYAAQGTTVNLELFQTDSQNNPLLGEDIVFPVGTTRISNVIGIEGRTTTDQFVGTGEVGQSYQLNIGPVIFDSIIVKIDGIQWTRVDFFTDSQPRREFRVEYDSNWQAFIIFGNNRAGLIPSPGSVIQASYRVGGGTIGNIVVGTLEHQEQASVPGFLTTITVNFVNYTTGKNGYDGDTIEDIRRKMPKYLRTQNRAVSGDDYKTLADQFATPYFGQVGKSTAVLRNHGCAGNIIDLYILSLNGVDGLVTPTDDLKIALKQELENKKMFTDFVCVRDGAVLTTDITVDVTLDKFYRKFELEMKAKILSRITAFFSLNNWDFGQMLKSVDITKSLADIKEIQSVDVNLTTVDPNNSGSIVTAKFYEVIRPDQISISFIYV